MNSKLSELKSRLEACDLCPHQCGVNRNAGQTGICGVTGTPKIYQHFLHYGEEISIIPAFVVNLAGCNLRCPDCPERHRWTMPALKTGAPEYYARALIQHWEKSGFPKTIEWIGGEPSLNLPYILEVSEKLKMALPQCPKIYLNTNGYFESDLVEYMDGCFDGFVWDLKCMPSCARELVGYHHYFEVVTNNILNGYQRWPVTNQILRHLVVPGHLECCTKEIIRWCEKEIPKMIFNLMTGFYGEDGRMLDEWECRGAEKMLKLSGLENVMLNGEYIRHG